MPWIYRPWASDLTNLDFVKRIEIEEVFNEDDKKPAGKISVVAIFDDDKSLILRSFNYKDFKDSNDSTKKLELAELLVKGIAESIQQKNELVDLREWEGV